MIRSTSLGFSHRRPRAEELTEAPTAEALHGQYLDEVYRYVSRRISRREEAEDVTAEVFASAFAALPSFRGRCPVRLWLLGIARRKVADALRHRTRRPETLVSEMGGAEEQLWERLTYEPADAALQRAQRVRVLHDLLTTLKEDQREALLLQHLEGLSIAEIGAVLGRSPAAVNSLLQRARVTLLRRGSAFFLNQGAEE